MDHGNAAVYRRGSLSQGASGIVTPSSSSSQVLFRTPSCSVSTLATAWQREDRAEKRNQLNAEVVTTEHAGKRTGDKTETQPPKSSVQM